jgi:hypothetical protein
MPNIPAGQNEYNGLARFLVAATQEYHVATRLKN